MLVQESQASSFLEDGTPLASRSANAVHPQGDPCVDHSGSLSSQIPGFPQADSMLGAVGMILCKAAPVDDTVYTDIGS